MKKIKLWLLSAFALTASVTLTSCGDDDNNEPEYPYPPTENPSDPSTIIDGLTRSQVEKLVAQTVSATASYTSYTWNFKIESTLHQQLPSHTIEFGIGHGVINGEESVSVGSQAYSYTKRTSGGKVIAEFKNPFWFYFIFGMPQTDNEAWANCEMYYNSYMALTNMGYANLSSEQKDLYKNLQKELNSYENQAKYSYEPSVQVVIDSRYYFTVKRYVQK